MRTDELQYELPPERIAQDPSPRREDARLMTVDRASGERRHLSVRDLPGLLLPGDLLVRNETRVVAARLHATRRTGGRVRLLLLRNPAEGPVPARWKASGRLRAGEILDLVGGEGTLRVAEAGPGSRLLVEPADGKPWAEVLLHSGRPPLPPYIKRPFHPDPRLDRDRERYQTVYACDPGSVAAPTAGLHWTEEALQALRAREVGLAGVTLHVGPGTFTPVTAETLEEHRMEAERALVPPETARAVEETRARGGRVVAVGTTVVRALEAASASGTIRPFDGETSLFILPPFSFRSVDALLTNFHLPGSTLLALVGAFAGLDRVLEAYREAIDLGYRFYSYGDACFFH
jgi:S-adenosylmethionine:tRNA ribosyltransferase-isomerase